MQCVYCAVPFNIIRLILVFKQGLLHLFLSMSQLSPFAAERSMPREGYRSGKRCQGDDSHVGRIATGSLHPAAVRSWTSHCTPTRLSWFSSVASIMSPPPKETAPPSSQSSSIHCSLFTAPDTDNVAKWAT